MLRHAYHGGLKECVLGNRLPSQTAQRKDNVLTGLVAGLACSCCSELEFGVKAWEAAGLPGPRERVGRLRLTGVHAWLLAPGSCCSLGQDRPGTKGSGAFLEKAQCNAAAWSPVHGAPTAGTGAPVQAQRKVLAPRARPVSMVRRRTAAQNSLRMLGRQAWGSRRPQIPEGQ